MDSSKDPTKCIYRNRFGKRGELIAKEHLIKSGLKFITANYRYERAEADLIFEDEKNKIIIFIEVKSRTNKKFGEPEESITPAKQEQIKKAAMGYLMNHTEFSTHDIRLDVVSCMFTGADVAINHIENAF